MVSYLLRSFSIILAMIALLESSVTFFRGMYYIYLFKDIWNFAFIYTKTEKVTNFFRKNICILFENLYRNVINLGSLTCAFFFFSTLTYENWNVHPLMTLLIAMILRCLLYLTIGFNIGFDSLSAKRLTSSHSGIFMFLTAFERKVFRSPVL